MMRHERPVGRVAHVAERPYGDYFLTATGAGATVLDDDAKDILTGGSGSDWFFAQLSDSAVAKDRITDLKDEAFADDLSFIVTDAIAL